MTTISPVPARAGRRRIVLASAVLVLAAGTIAAAVAPGGAAGAAPAGSPGWHTVWADEFTGRNGTAPSSTNWKYDTGQGIFGTGEIETMTSSTRNVSLDGKGDLRLTARRESDGSWTSGRIETNRDDFRPPAGGELKVSARIEVPSKSGKAGLGYWPAFWMLGTPVRSGTQWPGVGEFDILEDVNGQNLTYGTFHCGVDPGGPCNEPNGLGAKRPCPDTYCQGNFHTYSLTWTRGSSTEYLRWYVDGHLYHTISSRDVDATTWANATHHSSFIILDLAMGGGFPNGVSGMTTPTATTQSGGSMLIQYVRVQSR